MSNPQPHRITRHSGNMKGRKWSPMKKSEPWRGPILSWDQIKDSFPTIHSPEEAIRRTVKACKKLGLVSCPGEGVEV